MPAADHEIVGAAELITLADCYRVTGQAVRALAVLRDALALVGDEGIDSRAASGVLARVGQIYAGLGEYEAAAAAFEQGLGLVNSVRQTATAASLLNDLGSVYAATDAPLEAMAAFADSTRLAEPASAVAASADINLARALWENEAASASETFARLERARASVTNLAATSDRPSMLLGIGELMRDVAAAAPDVAARARPSALAALADGLEAADALGDARLVSFGHGYLARFYEDAGDLERALVHTREAANRAQAVGSSESLYRWEWQLGRLHRAAGRRADALVAYEAAVATLERAGSTPAVSQRRFQQEIAPLYRQYADLVLASTSPLAPTQAQAALIEVQAALEQFKVAEVQNYFENQCVVPETLGFRTPSDDVVVVYPVVFDDRLELLVAASDELRQFTVNVTEAELAREIRALRAAIEDGEGGRDHLVYGARLDDWLVRPLAPALEQLEPTTLVIVPDGVLRLLPFAALHDGRRFLVERHALAVTPSLGLISAGNAAPTAQRVLANGLVAPVQGFAALPYVASELASIEALMPARTFTDEAFRTVNVEREILAGEYSIVHMATHARFDADFRRSFLLTYDSLITMDQLEDMMGIRRFTSRPVDLLVLSACQTAAGDERAALGLAGVAVKAGARSALATLWLINDASTAELVGEFYRQLATGSMNKAEALRGAQLKLLNDEAHAHPAHWAPFLMIGDWR